MQYRYTILYVADVKQSLDFYHKAFGFEIKFITPEEDYGELLTGETSIAFASLQLGNSNFSEGFEALRLEKKPIGVEMAFTTEEIEADFQKAVEAGASIFEPIKEKAWGQKVGYVLDNNGFLIEICTPISSS
ncbi:MAG: VOC family protein [Bacteroidia bacterium]|nr:VOC family protein [Bacteroidia bacterium]